MDFLALLDKQLKNDNIIEILEHYEMTVTYDFDRTYEGTEDRYWAAAHNAGFQLRFNAEQILDVVFLYLAERHGFAPIDQSLGVPIYKTFDEAEKSLVSNGQSFIACPALEGEAMHKMWIKHEEPGRAVHYEFDGGAICMITLMRVDTT